jgi:hypothetical protein
VVAEADDAIEYVGAEGGSIHGGGCVRGRGEVKAGVLLKRDMMSVRKAGVEAGVFVGRGVVVEDEAVGVWWGRNSWRAGAAGAGMSVGISPPNRERRVAVVSCREVSVDCGKMKIIAGVAVLSEDLRWNPRRSGYSL